jgi:hypothetical protein
MYNVHFNNAGVNQRLTAEQVPGAPMTFYLKTSCGRYLSYPDNCEQHIVDTWPLAGENQAFEFVHTGSGMAGEYYIVAIGRGTCPYR